MHARHTPTTHARNSTSLGHVRDPPQRLGTGNTVSSKATSAAANGADLPRSRSQSRQNPRSDELAVEGCSATQAPRSVAGTTPPRATASRGRLESSRQTWTCNKGPSPRRTAVESPFLEKEEQGNIRMSKSREPLCHREIAAAVPRSWSVTGTRR